jgi:hypothetical protein
LLAVLSCGAASAAHRSCSPHNKLLSLRPVYLLTQAERVTRAPVIFRSTQGSQSFRRARHDVFNAARKEPLHAVAALLGIALLLCSTSEGPCLPAAGTLSQQLVCRRNSVKPLIRRRLLGRILPTRSPLPPSYCLLLTSLAPGPPAALSGATPAPRGGRPSPPSARLRQPAALALHRPPPCAWRPHSRLRQRQVMVGGRRTQQRLLPPAAWPPMRRPRRGLGCAGRRGSRRLSKRT